MARKPTENASGGCGAKWGSGRSGAGHGARAFPITDTGNTRICRGFGSS